MTHVKKEETSKQEEKIKVLASNSKNEINLKHERNNKMKKHISILTVSIALMLAFVTTAISQPMRGFHGNKGFMDRRQEMRTDLKLTGEQRVQMMDLRLEHQKQILPLRTELQGKMTELKLLRIEENPNLKKIDSKIDEISKLRSKMQKANARHQLEIRKLLTPDQQKIFDSKALSGQSRRAHGKRFHGRMPGKPSRCF